MCFSSCRKGDNFGEFVGMIPSKERKGVILGKERNCSCGGLWKLAFVFGGPFGGKSGIRILNVCVGLVWPTGNQDGFVNLISCSFQDENIKI